MRYAVYTTTADTPDLYSFAESYSKKEMAMDRLEAIKQMGLRIKAIVIEVSYPDQKIDPYAHHFWPKTTVSEVMKEQRAARRKAKEASNG